MASKAQRQQNIYDVTGSYDRWRDLIEKHLPARRASILDYAITISGKRGW